jgi:GNAT superfamily N-acetyltransferase
MVTVVEIAAADTHALRRAVLREGKADADVHFPQDADPASFHLGAMADGELVGIATFTPAPTPHREGAVAWQLRGMAVAADQQGRRVGAAIVDAAVARLRDAGAEVLWCNARDTALGFYEKLGFSVYGDGFVTSGTGLPHHAMLIDLD